MKKLLYKIIFVTLLYVVNYGYATTDELEYEPNTLGGLPVELQSLIVEHLPLDDQLRSGMVDKNFNAINDDIIINGTAKQFGLNFEKMSQYCRKLLLNVGKGDFKITEVKFNEAPDGLHDPYIGNKPQMLRHDDSNNLVCSSLDDDGNIKSITIPDILNANGESLCKGSKSCLDCASRDMAVFAGTMAKSKDNILEQHDHSEHAKAIKYTTATKEFVDLFPENNGLQSVGTAINNNGNIIVGYIFNDSIKGIKGFIHNNNGDVTFLKGFQEDDYVFVDAVSDKGEVVGGNYSNSDSVGIESATIWLHDPNNNAKPYQPCILQNLLTYNCPKSYRAMLETTRFFNVVAVSPNGGAMLVMTRPTRETPASYFVIVFGSNVKSEVENIAVAH